MTIGCDLILQLGLSVNFKCGVLQWDGATGTTKEPSGLIGKSDLPGRDIHEVVMQAEEPASTR